MVRITTPNRPTGPPSLPARVLALWFPHAAEKTDKEHLQLGAALILALHPTAAQLRCTIVALALNTTREDVTCSSVAKKEGAIVFSACR